MGATGGRGAGAGRRGAEQKGESACGGAGGGGKSRAASAARGGGGCGRLVAGHCRGDGGRDGRRPAIDAEPEEPRWPTLAHRCILRLLGQRVFLIIYFIGQFRPRGNRQRPHPSLPRTHHYVLASPLRRAGQRPLPCATRCAMRRSQRTCDHLRSGGACPPCACSPGRTRRSRRGWPPPGRSTAPSP